MCTRIREEKILICHFSPFQRESVREGDEAWRELAFN